MTVFRRLALAVTTASLACADGPTQPSPDGRPGGSPAAASSTGAAWPRPYSFSAGDGSSSPGAVGETGWELRDQDLYFLVSGQLVGENPAGMGIYLERPAGVGRLPMGITFRQNGLNLWGTGLDEATGDPYPDYVSVFQTTVGDVFRFREGGRAILGNGIGRPEPDHVLTLHDRDNGYIENILNLSRSTTGSSVRYLRAFDGGSIPFAVGEEGRTGVGRDFSPDYMLDVLGETNARGHRTIADRNLMRDVSFVGDPTPQLGVLRPVRFSYDFGPSGSTAPRFGLAGDDVAVFFPELVRQESRNGFLSVDYDQLTVLLLRTVQLLQERVACLEEALSELEEEVIAPTPRGGAARAGGAPEVAGRLPPLRLRSCD